MHHNTQIFWKGNALLVYMRDQLCLNLHHSPTAKNAPFPSQHYITIIRKLLENTKNHSFPIIEYVPPTQPGTYLSIHAIAEASQELINSSTDLLSFSIPSGTLFSSLSTNRLFFTLGNAPDRTFLFLEAKGLVEDLASCSLLQEQADQLRSSILFTLEYPTASLHLAALSFRSITSLLIHQRLLKKILRKNKKNQPLFVEELQRFLLATDDMFKTLRTPKHLLKLVVTHNFLREQLAIQEKKEKKLFFNRVEHVLVDHVAAGVTQTGSLFFLLNIGH